MPRTTVRCGRGIVATGPWPGRGARDRHRQCRGVQLSRPVAPARAARASATNSGDEGVHGLVQEFDHQFRAWPRLRRGTDPGGVLQDLIVGQRQDRGLRGCPRPPQPHLRHRRPHDSQHGALPVVHGPVRQQRLSRGSLRQPGEPFEDAGQHVGVGAPRHLPLGLLAQCHHRRAACPGDETFPYDVSRHDRSGTPGFVAKRPSVPSPSGARVRRRRSHDQSAPTGRRRRA